ncbi:MAG TPA: alpha/beta hydrolase [Fontimonas sp.]
MQKIVTAALLAALIAGCSTSGPNTPADDAPPSAPLLTWDDVTDLPEPPPLPALPYGSDPQQFGELRVPPGVDGPFPVLILIHGDCWKTDEGMAYMRPLAHALANLGVATWNIEYRRPTSGADWSTAYSDVALATDFLRTLAVAHSLDLKRVVSSGHAVGGQLAMWLATRPKLAKADPLYEVKPLPMQGVIGLAAVTRLPAAGDASGCPGIPADAKLPALRFPLGVPQWFVHGAQDALTPSDVVLKYAESARKKGDKVTLGITTNAGHFEPVAPTSSTWTALQQAVIAALLQ